MVNFNQQGNINIIVQGVSQMSVLFILKRKESSDDHSDCYNYTNDGFATGLLNSAKFVVDMLNEHDIESNLVVVSDNNDIDREVTKYRPDVVIIEALWVVPEKFEILSKLHPHVQWIVRLHSAIPFIANEGIAMKWIFEYLKHDNVWVSCNDKRILHDLIEITEERSFDCKIVEDKLLYQPNFYPLHLHHKRLHIKDHTINIGCFGAVRPMKNQLIQAIAAIRFADENHLKLVFHVNGGRIEMKGAPVMHNLIDLFEQLADHKLVIHDWCDHDDFKMILHKEIDLAMQVSYSETFNIVAADCITESVPIVTSDEIKWSALIFQADPNDTCDIVEKLQLAYDWPRTNLFFNTKGLKAYNKQSVKEWIRSLEILNIVS